MNNNKTGRKNLKVSRYKRIKVSCYLRETTIFEEMNKLIKNIIHVVFCIVLLICIVGVNKRDSTAIVCRAAEVRERI